MNDYDHSARFVARHLDRAGFFLWLRGADFHAAWDWLGWLDTQNVPEAGEDDLRCDTVAAFRRRAHDGPPLALIIEFMSHSRADTLFRLTQYTLSIRKDHLYQESPRVHYDVIGTIINLTGKGHTNVCAIAPKDVDGLGFVARYQVRTLPEESARELLEGVQAGRIARTMLAWAPLMREGDTAEYIAMWRAEVEREPDEMQQGNMVGLAKIFSDLAKRRELWFKGVQGMNDVRSQVVLEWEARGEARGIAIGEARAKLESARNSLMQCLEVRFAANLPPGIASVIDNETDLSHLQEWFKQALTAANLEAFIAAIGWSDDGSK